MPIYQIEMFWTCAQCKHAGNRGLARHCDNCGHPKDDKCEEFFPKDISENNAIRDPDKLKLAKAGPDWKCKYCDTLQSTMGPFCSYCGADRETGAKPWQAKVKRITQNTVTGEKHEQEPIIFEKMGKTIVADETVKLPPPKIIDTSSSWESDKLPISQSLWFQTGIGGIVIIGICFALWAIFRTKIVDATVMDVVWEYKVLIDRYQIWRHEGWDTDPGAFDIRNEGSRIHHYDRVVSGSHQEPYQESYTCGETCTTTPRTCTSNKNGTATCTGGDRSCSPKSCFRTAYRTVTDYQDEPRYRDWYSWHVWDWGYNRTVAKSGHDFAAYWPKPEELTVSLKSGERERQRNEEHYKVIFSTPKRTYDIEPKTLTEFKLYPPGRHVKLKVGIAHGVEVLPDK